MNNRDMQANADKPSLSIIVPVYNVADNILLCLESIAAQTFTDYECIIVDDGSTDGTGRLCDNFAANHERFTVIHHAKNLSLSDARNTGIEVARGRYIGFVDGDDFIQPEMMQVMYDRISSSGEDMVMSDIQMVKRQNSAALNNKPVIWTEADREHLFKLWFGTLQSRVMNPVWNHLYSREAIDDLRFVSGLTPAQDVEFNMRVLLRCKRIGIVNQVYYNWYIRQGSLSYQSKSMIVRFYKIFNLVTWFMENFGDRLTERERGYVQFDIMKKTIYGRNIASLKGESEIAADFKHQQSLVEPQFMSNSTIPLYRKVGVYLLGHSRVLFKLYLKYIYNRRERFNKRMAPDLNQ